MFMVRNSLPPLPQAPTDAFRVMYQWLSSCGGPWHAGIGSGGGACHGVRAHEPRSHSAAVDRLQMQPVVPCTVPLATPPSPPTYKSNPGPLFLFLKRDRGMSPVSWHLRHAANVHISQTAFAVAGNVHRPPCTWVRGDDVFLCRRPLGPFPTKCGRCMQMATHICCSRQCVPKIGLGVPRPPPPTARWAWKQP